MARIRTIKPDATESESLARLSRDVVLTFALLWTQCDDHGRTRSDPRLVRAAIYPLRDDVSVEDVAVELDELEAEGCICRYEGDDGKSYLHVVNWDKHQRIDHPGKSRVPECPKEKHGGIPETLAKVSRDIPKIERLDLGPRTVDLGEREIDQPATIQRIAPKQSAELFEEFWSIYPKRVAKGAARKAWDKAVKTTGPEDIIQGAKRYAADRNRDDKFTKHPATWINQQCWLDETGHVNGQAGDWRNGTALAPIWTQ